MTLMSLIWTTLNVSLTWYTLTPLWRSISDVPRGLHLTGNHGPGKRLVAPATGLTEFRTRLWHSRASNGALSQARELVP